jgi:ABC-2 type transport system ATP-binding protein
MWEVISDLVADGTTVLLTTQYLEEADQLAEKIVVIDRGHVIAQGTSDELKTQVGGDRLEVVIHSGSNLDDASTALRALADGDVSLDAVTRRITAPVSGGSTILVEAVRALDVAGVSLDDIALRRPTLDDVFLSLTGHAAEEVAADSAKPTRGRGRARKGAE